MLKLFIVAACALGLAAAYPDPYVLYGRTATQGQFPFAGWLSSCSASILDKRTLITVAHCVCSFEPTSVVFGAVNGRTPEAGSQRYNLDTSRQVIHPDYPQCDTVGKNDIAILKTTTDIQFNSVIGKIPLHDAATTVGQSVTICGYGQDENKSYGVLKYATNNVQTCARYFGAVCHSMSPSSPYYHDGGAPLFVTIKGQYRLVGLVSGMDFKNNQAFYANVFDSLSWIKSQLEK